MTGIQWTEETVASVIASYSGGKSIDAIAAEIGSSRGTVGRLFHDRGVKLMSMGGRRLGLSITIPSEPVHIAYLAGIFDGEGHLQIRRRPTRSVAGKIAIYSTTKELMDWLTDNIGGKARWSDTRTKRFGWKPIGIWEVYRINDVVPLLHAMLPFLIIKKKVALEAIACMIEE